MRRILSLSVPFLVCTTVLLFPVDPLLAKGKGGGRGRASSSRSTSRPSQPKYQPRTTKSFSVSPSDRKGSPYPSTVGQSQRIDRATLQNGIGSSRDTPSRLSNARTSSITSTAQNDPIQPTDPTFDREEHKLDHRLQIAEHLRDNSARNGNPNLLNTADRMEQRAYDHYRSRMYKTDADGPSEEILGDNTSGLRPDELAAISPPTSPSAMVPNRSETRGSDDALGSDFQPFNARREIEDRKLQHQLDVAQQLRDIADRNGNENLLRTADRMEQMAISRYQRSLGLLDSDPSELSQVERLPILSGSTIGPTAVDPTR